MKKSLPWLAGLGLGIGLALTPIVSGEAAPARSMLLGLESAADADVTPIHCRRYHHCHRRCVRRVFGVCRRHVRECHCC